MLGRMTIHQCRLEPQGEPVVDSKAETLGKWYFTQPKTKFCKLKTRSEQENPKILNIPCQEHAQQIRVLPIWEMGSCSFLSGE